MMLISTMKQVLVTVSNSYGSLVLWLKFRRKNRRTRQFRPHYPGDSWGRWDYYSRKFESREGKSIP